MTIHIDITEFGLSRAIRMTDGIADRTDDLYPVNLYIAQDFERIMEEQFDTEGASTGSEWQELSEAWWDHKVAVGKDHGVLQYNQRLVRSLTTTNDDSIRDVGDDEVTVGTTVEYGAYHLFGTRSLPRRNFMRIPANSRRHWAAVIQRYITTGRLY
jgi:phage gpG-like protein